MKANLKRNIGFGRVIDPITLFYFARWDVVCVDKASFYPADNLLARNLLRILYQENKPFSEKVFDPAGLTSASLPCS